MTDSSHGHKMQLGFGTHLELKTTPPADPLIAPMIPSRTISREVLATVSELRGQGSNDLEITTRLRNIGMEVTLNDVRSVIVILGGLDGNVDN